MARIRGWSPDTCPPGSNPCVYEINEAADTGNFVRAIRLCTLHAGQPTPAADKFDAAIQSSRVKETARETVMVERGLTTAPGFTVGADGNITIPSGVSGAARTAIRTAVANAIAPIRKPSGTVTVTIS